MACQPHARFVLHAWSLAADSVSVYSIRSTRQGGKYASLPHRALQVKRGAGHKWGHSGCSATIQGEGVDRRKHDWKSPRGDTTETTKRQPPCKQLRRPSLLEVCLTLGCAGSAADVLPVAVPAKHCIHLWLRGRYMTATVNRGTGVTDPTPTYQTSQPQGSQLPLLSAAGVGQVQLSSA